MRNLVISILTACLITACSKKNTSIPLSPTSNLDTFITYHKNIKPIIDKYCVTCHSTYLIHLDNYTNLKQLADSDTLNKRLFIAKDMPPKNSPQPGKEELDLIHKWIETGSKE